MIILNCFGKIRQQLDEKYAVTQETPVTYYDQVISKVKEYIKENYKEASLEDAAVQVSLSPSYLSRIFKEKCGMGFSDYLTKTRMEKACELLGTFNIKVMILLIISAMIIPRTFPGLLRPILE